MNAIKYIAVICFLALSTALMGSGNPVYQTSSASYKSIGAGGGAAAGVGGASMRSGAAVSSPGAAMGVSIPTVSFHSTSTMKSSGSTLVSTITDYNTPNDGMGKDNGGAFSDRRRVGPNTPPTDPMDDPLTDAVPCLLLLAAGYALWQWRRKKAAESRHRG